MLAPLHITSGDYAAESLKKSGLPGKVFAWHDVLYEGARTPGWPTAEAIEKRVEYLYDHTGGGLQKDKIRQALSEQYELLSSLDPRTPVVLWFDSCLFDQSMLVHILHCMDIKGLHQAELICVDSFPGIEPFNGLGQLTPQQLAGLYDTRLPVTPEQYTYACISDDAFASRDLPTLTAMASEQDAPLQCTPACIERWLAELPDENGLGLLDRLILQAVKEGSQTPGDIFHAVAALDTPPQYWGDTTLWDKINRLAERDNPLLKISGPSDRLPQWNPGDTLKEFSIDSV